MRMEGRATLQKRIDGTLAKGISQQAKQRIGDGKQPTLYMIFQEDTLIFSTRSKRLADSLWGEIDHDGCTFTSTEKRCGGGL